MNGTIRKRGKGSWELRCDLPRDVDGKRRRQHVSFKGSKTDAQHRLRELLALAEGGLPLDNSRLTLRDYLEQWLDSHSSKIRVRTLYGYRNVLRGQVMPALGSSRLSKLQPVQIERLYSGLVQRGLSPRTVLQTHRILKKALEQAVRWNLIPRNPADLVDPPTFEQPEMLALNSAELRTLFAGADDPQFGPAFFICAHTGMRRGEIVGLQWRDIDFDNGLVSVVREIVFVPGEGHIVSPPKSAKGRRVIDIAPDVVAGLRRHRAAQAEHRLSIAAAWRDEGWLFTKPDGREPKG